MSLFLGINSNNNNETYNGQIFTVRVRSKFRVNLTTSLFDKLKRENHGWRDCRLYRTNGEEPTRALKNLGTRSWGSSRTNGPNDASSVNTIEKVQGVTRSLIYHPVNFVIPKVGTSHYLIPPMTNVVPKIYPPPTAPISFGEVYTYPYMPPPIISNTPVA